MPSPFFEHEKQLDDGERLDKVFSGIQEVGDYIKHLRRERLDLVSQIEEARRIGKSAHDRFKIDMMNALYEIEKKHG